MWCIKNKLNNENEALLLDTQQNNLIPTSYIEIIRGRKSTKNNELIFNSQFHFKFSKYPIKKIELTPSIITPKIISRHNYVIDNKYRTTIKLEKK